MVKVDDIPLPSSAPLSDAVEHHLASVQLYSIPAVFQKVSDKRLKGTIFSQVGWDQLLVGVNIRDLCDMVASPTAVDTVYHCLTQAVECYYASLSPLVSSLPTFTARAILSTGEIGSQPFKPVQESVTLKKYSRFVALFLVFLLCHMASPVPEFSMPLHPAHAKQLSSLRALLDVEDSSGLQNKIHSTLISLLTYLSHEATLSDHRDLFTLFLLAYHLKDDVGNMTKASVVTPNISAAQWCLRATTVGELLQKANLYNGDTFKYILLPLVFSVLIPTLRAYEQHAKPLITDVRPSLFTYLQQKQAFFSTLAYSEPGLPQFIWDSTMTMLSVDGFPLSVD